MSGAGDHSNGKTNSDPRAEGGRVLVITSIQHARLEPTLKSACLFTVVGMVVHITPTEV